MEMLDLTKQKREKVKEDIKWEMMNVLGSWENYPHHPNINKSRLILKTRYGSNDYEHYVSESNNYVSESSKLHLFWRHKKRNI